MPAYAEVTNLRNGRKVVVRINDRGPFVGDRIIDLSYTAAAQARHAVAGHGAGGSARHHAASATGAGSAMPQRPARRAGRGRAPSRHGGQRAGGENAGRAPMYIQAGVFADHENARRRVEVLLAAGIELASLDEMQGARTLHRVRVGPFASVEEFDLNMKRLRELGISDARLLTD